MQRAVTQSQLQGPDEKFKYLKCSLVLLSTLGLLQAFWSVFCNVPSALWWEGAYDTDIPFKGENSRVSIICPLTRCGSLC